jgi:hypothetical protein
MSCSNIFDWLKHINQFKTPADQFSDKDWEVFNSYMIHRFISMNKEFIEVVNYVQELPPQEKVMIYNVYKEFIPKNNKWNKYIKSSNKENTLWQVVRYRSYDRWRRVVDHERKRCFRHFVLNRVTQKF